MSSKTMREKFRTGACARRGATLRANEDAMAAPLVSSSSEKTKPARADHTRPETRACSVPSPPGAFAGSACGSNRDRAKLIAVREGVARRLDRSARDAPGVRHMASDTYD